VIYETSRVVRVFAFLHNGNGVPLSGEVLPCASAATVVVA
jgi:hypothetical protein